MMKKKTMDCLKLIAETRPNWSDGYDDWFFAFEIQDCHEWDNFSLCSKSRQPPDKLSLTIESFSSQLFVCVSGRPVSIHNCPKIGCEIGDEYRLLLSDFPPRAINKICTSISSAEDSVWKT
jgi:hypothetical protein